ncbi:MAG: AI-2E family transporter, partial [Pseudomonadota bacterium]
LKTPRGLAHFISVASLFVLLTLLVRIIISSIEKIASRASQYKESLADSLSFVEGLLIQLNVPLEIEKLKALVLELPLSMYAKNAAGQLLSFLGNLFMVFIFSLFLISGESRGRPKSRLVLEILQKVSAYVSSKTSLSLITGFLVWLVLLFFKVELAFIFALLTVLFNFIPTIGSLIAILLPLPVVFLQYQLGAQFFVILVLTGVIQFVIGNVIEPKVMGDSMDLHPITVLVCLVFWGMVWGIAGMFLAVPITAVIKIIFQRIEATQGFAEILAGRLPTR